MANVLFYYFGDDEAYYRALLGEFRRHTRLVFDFKRIYESKESDIQTLFFKVFNDKPSCIFIDFSKQTQDYLHLARLISRTKFDHTMVVVGLVDYLSPPNLLPETIVTGVNLSYIKSAETFDVVYDVTRFIAPNECASHGFATADLKDEVWEVGIPCKVGYVTTQDLHIETDMKLDPGSKMLLSHLWLDPKLIPSREMFVKEVYKNNLFYQFKYAYDLDFLFVDDFVPTEGMDEEVILANQADREDRIRFSKNKMRKWVDDNQTLSKEKATKLLIIDRDFQFYNKQPRSDRHPYTIRCLPNFTEIAEELEKHMPQAVFFCIQNPIVAKEKKIPVINTLEIFEQMARIINAKYEDNKPILILFNSPEDSKTMQEKLQYNQLVTYPGEMTVEVVISMADMMQSRQKSISMPTSSKKVFVDKTKPASTAEIIRNINILKISESDLIFQTDHPLPSTINLRVRKPVNMYIKVMPSTGTGKSPEYMGLIHSISEQDKKNLRRYINSLFFKDHDAQAQAEIEEFKKLNELKLQEKLNAAKEAEEKKRQEEGSQGEDKKD